MRTFLMALAAAASLAGVTGTAQAATYTTTVTADPARPLTNEGLKTRAVILEDVGPQTFLGTDVTFDLTNVGDSYSQDIYALVAFDQGSIDTDDLNPIATSATFDFGVLGSVTAAGFSAATGSGALGSALATFSDVLLQVAPATAIRISLADTVFATDGLGNFVEGGDGKGVVNATFTLASIPLPAGLPLAATALGLLGFASRRRKTA